MNSLYSLGYFGFTAQAIRHLGGIELLCRDCHDAIHGIVNKKMWYYKYYEEVTKQEKNTRLIKVKRRKDSSPAMSSRYYLLKAAGYNDILIENMLMGAVSKTHLAKMNKRRYK